MYEPGKRQVPYLAFMWPALAAASASEAAALLARQFAGLAVGRDAHAGVPEPKWATPNNVALELRTVRLRDFSTASIGTPTLVCAPFALHGSSVADLAPGHSLVAALDAAGLQRLWITDWRSATPEMRYRTIDDYLADLNVLVDTIGPPVDLIGLCQGGWLSLLYAARFPDKVRKLVLAGAPIDIAAGSSGLSTLIDSSPAEFFQELVKLGGGLVRGQDVQRFWGPEDLSAAEIRALLQASEPPDSLQFAKLATLFRDWYAWTVDLPGVYYLEVVDRLFRANQIAEGTFVALGQTIDLASVRGPIFMLAARDDELVAPEQLFATERLIGTPLHAIRKALAPCRHGGLFMGKRTLADHWPRIARWLLSPESDEIVSRDEAA